MGKEKKRIGMSGPGPLRPVGTGKWRRGLGDGEGMRSNGFFLFGESELVGPGLTSRF